MTEPNTHYALYESGNRESDQDEQDWLRAEQDEQDWRPVADLRVVGQETDAERRQAHQQQRPHEHGLAANPIAEMPENNAADRTGEVSDAKGCERR